MSFSYTPMMLGLQCFLTPIIGSYPYSMSYGFLSTNGAYRWKISQFGLFLFFDKIVPILNFSVFKSDFLALKPDKPVLTLHVAAQSKIYAYILAFCVAIGKDISYRREDDEV